MALVNSSLEDIYMHYDIEGTQENDKDLLENLKETIKFN